jgi:hypothetical protein
MFQGLVLRHKHSTHLPNKGVQISSKGAKNTHDSVVATCDRIALGFLDLLLARSLAWRS